MRELICRILRHHVPAVRLTGLAADGARYATALLPLRQPLGAAADGRPGEIAKCVAAADHTAGFLYRTGRFCTRFRWPVVLVWLVAAVLLVALAQRAGENTNDNLSLPGTGSNEATSLLQQRFPNRANPAVPLLLRAPSGTLEDQRYASAIAATASAYAHDPARRRRRQPALAGGRRAAQEPDDRLPLALAAGQAKRADRRRGARDVRRGRAGAGAGLQVAAGGYLGQQLSQPSAESSEAIGLLVALIVLLFTFGTVVAAGPADPHRAARPRRRPVAGHAVRPRHDRADRRPDAGHDDRPRRRHRLRAVPGHPPSPAPGRGMSVAESIPRTVATSGNAIVFAGGTVIIALCSLGLAGIPIVASMGYSAAIVVVIAVLAAITLVPALLAVLGTRMNALKVPGLHHRAARAGTHGWRRWAEAVAHRPWRALAAGLAILDRPDDPGPVAAPRPGRQQDGVAAAATRASPSTCWPPASAPAFNGPLLVTVDGAPDAAALAKLDAGLKAADGIAAGRPPIPAADGRATVITATPTTAPAALSTEALVRRLRIDAIPATGVVAAVGGQTASGVDLAAQISDRLPQVILTVIALSFLLLMVAFRSILLPLKAAVDEPAVDRRRVRRRDARLPGGLGHALIGLAASTSRSSRSCR